MNTKIICPADPVFCPRCGWTGTAQEADRPGDKLATCPSCKPRIPVIPTRGGKPEVVVEIVDVITAKYPVGTIANALLMGRRPCWRVTYWTITR